MDTPVTPLPPTEPQPSSRFSFRKLFGNRKIVLTSTLIILLLGYGVWARFGFTLEFMRFFAAESPTVVINNDHLFTHGERVDVSWSANTAQECNSLNGWINTDGDNEGNAQSNPINACNGNGNGIIDIECSYENGDSGRRQERFNYDTSTCPEGQPVCDFDSDCDDGNPNTTDTCVNPGESNSRCTNVVGNPTPTPTATITPSPTNEPYAGCGAANMRKLDTPGIGIGGGRATSRVRNDATDTCKIILASYEIWSDRGGSPPHYISQQTRYSYDVKIVGAGQTITLSTGIPDCYSQNDLLVGNQNDPDNDLAPPVSGNFGSGNFFGVQFADGPYCNEAETPTSSTTTTATVTATPSATPVAVLCEPATQSRLVNQIATITAAGGNGTFSWSAPNGSPTSGTGASFGVAYNSAGTYSVQVTSGGQSATCAVVVTQPSGFVCTPATQSAYIDQSVNFAASGGAGSYTWSAPSAVTTTGSGATFSTNYKSTGSYTVTVTSGTENRTCAVAIAVAPTPTPTPTPSTPGLSLVKLVRNITSGSGEVDLVSANAGNTVEFIIHVSSYGNTTVRNVRLSDVVPQGVSFISGSTLVDGVVAGDGLVSGGLLLGDIIPGRTITVRFRALVASESTFSVGTTTLTNTASATSDNVPPVSDPAFVSVTRAAAAPQITLYKYGRNITRGEFGELHFVTAYPNNTIEFIIHVRNVGSSTLSSLLLTDILPSYIAYISNTTSVDGIQVSDGVAGSGIQIGPLTVGQEKVVRFSGRVAAASALPVGTSSVINTAQTDNPALIAQLPIIINNGIIAGAGAVPTGAEDSVFTALLISLVITLMYVTYTRTQLFKTRELESIVKRNKGEDTFDFKK